MGFLDGFMKGYNDYKSDKVIIEIENDEDDELLSNNYRRTGLNHTPSNNGWYRCIKCGKSFREGDMDIDHIIPKSKGGTNSRYNLQCICKHCNRSKGNDTSETGDDLKRRRKELKEEEREDLEFLRNVRKRNGGQWIWVF